MGVAIPELFFASLAVFTVFIAFAIMWEIRPVLTTFSALYGSPRPLLVRVSTRYTLITVAAAGILLAASGPYTEGGSGDVASSTFDLVLLVDSSISMSARANPNSSSRLERAQIISKEILLEFPEANVALCEFTNRVFCRAPLGSSRSVVENVIAVLGPDAITGTGSGIIQALGAIPSEFLRGSEAGRALVVLSDGGEELNAYWRNAFNRALENVSASGIYTIAVGMGGSQPLPVALSSPRSVPGTNQIVYDVVYSTLNEETMRHIAAKTGGRYVHESTLFEGEGLAEMSASLSEAKVLRSTTKRLDWIPGLVSFAAGLSYLVLFWKDP